MCGIVAIISEDAPVIVELLTAAMRSMGHRGPDGQHFWLSDDRRAGLGHVRLSVIDLETGRQPIASEDKRLHIVVNGELYEFERLQRSLSARGHKLRTRSDSEVAVHLYEELGPRCLELLRGEFAFALWNERDRTLFAARDRFGIKPLFYAQHAGRLILASEIKALFAAGVPPEWDDEGMFQALHFCPHQEHTIYRGVRQVSPGHYLTARSGRVSLRRYWDVTYPRRWEKRPLHSEESCIHDVGRRIEEAVRIRTRADVPIACYLSGGVDSSSVLGIAAMQTNRKVAAFTIGFDHPQYDESEPAACMARHAGVDFHPVRIGHADMADVFEAAIAQGEGLQINGHGAARYILSREVQRAGYKVVLGGEGADELFGGYHFASAALSKAVDRPRLASVRVLKRLLARPPRALREVGNVSPLLARGLQIFGFPEDLLGSLGNDFSLLRSLLNPDFVARHAEQDPYREFLRQFRLRDIVTWEPFQAIIYIWMKSHFPNYVLAGERLDMAHAVEVRLPYLDHLLFGRVRELPGALLFKGSQNKYLLRRIVAAHVPKRVLGQPKRPFFAPPSAQSLGNPLYTVVQDLTRCAEFGDVPFFNHAAVRRFTDSMERMSPSRRAAADPILYLMASFAVLQRHYGITGA